MSKLAVVGTVVTKPGARDEVLRAALAHRERCLTNESGTLAFEALVPKDDSTTLLFYELYADADSFAAHANGESMAQLVSDVGSKVESITTVECTPAAEA